MKFQIYDSEIRTVKRIAKRNIYMNLKAWDRKLDKISRKADRVIKGTGDIIGMLFAGMGLVTLIMGAACADSIATEQLNKWGFVMVIAVITLAAGVSILDWMRS